MGDLIDTVQIAARVPKKDRDALEEIAQRDDRKLSYVIRRAIRREIEAHARQGAA